MLGNVVCFRRSAAFSAVALLLLILSASPVTAPFSTFSFSDIAGRGLAAVHKTLENLTSDDHHILLSSTTDGPEIVPQGEMPRSILGRAPEVKLLTHSVLRV